MDDWGSFLRLIIGFDGELRSIEQEFENFRVVRWQFRDRLEHEFDFLASWDIAFAAQVAAFGDEIILRVDHVQVTLIQPIMTEKIFVERLGPWREEDGFASLSIRHVLVISHSMPKLFGDGGEDRVKQPQGVRKGEVCFGARGGAALNSILS